MSRATTSTGTQQTGTQSFGTQPQQSGTQTQVPHDKIAMRAYEKWCRRGRPNGTDKQDWLEAEQELRQEMRGGTGPTRR
jgi:hypothetical protein